MSGLLKPLTGWLAPVLDPLSCIDAPQRETNNENAAVLLKRLEALLARQFRHAVSGEKRSILKGQGLDFADLREYSPGDDIRKIDWNVLARTLTPHIKEFHEEKQITIWLLVDLTPSMFFGRTQSKAALALELVGLLGLMGFQANHKLGFYVMTRDAYEIIPPKTGYAHLQFAMQKLLDLSRRDDGIPAQPPTLETHAQRFLHLVQKNSSVFTLSDFLSESDAWEAPLGQLSRHGRLIHLHLTDPSESDLPEGGMLPAYDPESGRLVLLDCGDAVFRRYYSAAAREKQDKIRAMLKRTGFYAQADTGRTAVEILTHLLDRQQRRPA